MIHKEYLAALMLAAFSTVSMAQTGGSASTPGTPLNCQGLVGGAMAQCVQGMGSSRAASATSRQDNRPPAPRETARPATAPAAAPAGSVASSGNAPGENISIGASIGSAISGFFSGWGSSPAPKTGGGTAAIGVPLRCQGMVGGAMAQCVQGIGSSSNKAGTGASVTATADATNESTNSFSNISTNMNFGNNSLKCQNLTGGAMARCLQGN